MLVAMTGYDDLVHASHVLYCIAATLVDVLYCTAGDRADTPLHIVAISHPTGGTGAPLWYQLSTRGCSLEGSPCRVRWWWWRVECELREGMSPIPCRNSLRAIAILAGWSSKRRPLELGI